jgi:integrase
LLIRRCRRKVRTDRTGKDSTRCDHGKSPCRWGIRIDYGYVDEAETGRRRRRMKWETFRGDEKGASAKRDEIAVRLRANEYVEATRLTVGAWLDTWLAERVKPSLRPSTYESYAATVKKHLVPALGSIPLQALRPGQLTKYYLERQTLSRATLDVHHSIISSALKSAMKQGLLTRNVATLAEGRPKAKSSREDAKKHCWTAEQAVAFLAAADAAGPQLSALFALALDSGMRKGELLALPWSAVDLATCTVKIDRTLLEAGREPRFGPTKTGAPRTVDITPETVNRLVEHKKAQAELKMRNRVAYHDLGLVFAKEWGDVYGREGSLGLPLQANNFGEREFARVLKAAGPGVPRIKVHGLRHTSATLLLAAGVPPHLVAARLGHSKVATTLEVYAHALPGHGQQAARTIGSLLYGTGK